MYSNQYYYFQIRPDQQLSKSEKTQKIKEYLNNLKELKAINEFTYSNNKNFPFISIALFLTESDQGWSDQDFNQDQTNLLVIVGSKYDSNNYSQYVNLLSKIASFLNWELILEETDDGQIDYRIWSTSIDT